MHRDGKWVKFPFQANGRLASTTNPATWGSFKSIADAYRRGKWSGVGFVLSKDDPFVAIDLDHVIDLDKKTGHAWMFDLVKRFDSYTEFSPSGSGLHIFIRGELPAQGRKRGAIEVYDRARFLTLTGRSVGSRKTIERRQKELDRLLAERFSAPAPTRVIVARSPSRLPDARFLELARNARNGAKFSALFDAGDLAQHGGDHSRADLALFRRLLFWTGGDAAQAERLFTSSVLGRRDKWTGRPDYRARTAAAALATLTDVYSGEGR